MCVFILLTFIINFKSLDMKRRFKIRIERKIKRKIKERQHRMSKTRLIVQDLKNTNNNHLFTFANK